ncbi:MAG: DAK2 domain-containing protein [Candidatus Eremiobacteraeota bacterium]|nr:DAK2 domain-containing protein [Candidatus Eremiobacteraeota bacterium]
MDVIALDGRGYAKFVTAGTYFLRKYRQTLNDLNVFPVPDGDTGTNMYLTMRQAVMEASKARGKSLAAVSAAAAQGSLMGARGNSGVILSQMLRGFAHHVRHRSEIDTFVLATGLREAIQAARQALLKPVEGTIVSVAEAAADAAYHLALHERDFYRLGAGIVRAANEALDRTPEQLPILKEAGVVDSGGAGFVYFIEGILRFLPDSKVRSTAFPRRPDRKSVFTAAQVVGEHKFCTEFVLERAVISVAELREKLAPRGESLIVAGAAPTIKVHVHTDNPEAVKALAAKHGTLTRVKVDDMERQHTVLLVDEPALAYSIAAVVPGPGFERIVKELGAEVVVSGSPNPSVRDLLLAVNKCLAQTVYLFANDSNVSLAALEAVKLTSKTVRVVPTNDIVGGIAGLFVFRSQDEAEPPAIETIVQAAARPRSARVYFAGKDVTLGGTTVARGKPAAGSGGTLYGGGSLFESSANALDALGASRGGLITLYYGGAQKERDAQRLSEELKSAFASAEVEYYYGGQKDAEYWVSLDD